MDLRNKDFLLNLNYDILSDKPKMFSTFICHIRRISIKQGFITVTQ